jgi:hypothetical protein
MTDLWAGTTKHSYDDIAKLRDEAPKLIAVLGENHEMSRQLKQAMEALDRTVREAQQKGSH